MDAGHALTLALAGGLAGALAGLVPGLHVNTLAVAALVLAAEGLASPALLVPFLLGALGAYTFASIIPLVTLGVPEGEDAPALLPGQRLARRGFAAVALHASATGSLVGLVVGCAFASIVFALLSNTRATALVQDATPVVAGTALIVLVWTDPAGPRRAFVVAVLAGVLGMGSLALSVSSPLDLPSTVLLPLFLGLYGLPALLDAARVRGSSAAPLAPEGRAPRTTWSGPVIGSLLGLVAGLFAGFTAGPATAVATLGRRRRDEDVLATASAVNTAAACVATAVLHASGRTRTGVHAATAALWPRAHAVAELMPDLAALVAGSAVALLVMDAVLRVVGRASRIVAPLAWIIAALWSLAVPMLTGWPGVFVMATALAVARTGRALGCRRSLLMAVLLAPAMVRVGVG